MKLLGDTDTTNVVDLLRNDHSAVKALFHEFEHAENDAQRQRIADKTLRELIQHAGAEEEVFYPAIREVRPTEETARLMDEAREEHHVAKMLIRELQGLRTVDRRYRAKFTVLAELVKHHAGEEEAEIFPIARTSGLDLEGLGKALIAAKGRALDRWEKAKNKGGAGEDADKNPSGRNARKPQAGARASKRRSRTGRNRRSR